MAWTDLLTNAQGEYLPNVNKGLAWMGNQVMGSTKPATRSNRLNSMVTGNQYVTGPQDRGVVHSSLARPQATSVKPTAPSRGTNSGKSLAKPRSTGSLKAPPPLVAARDPLATAQASTGTPMVPAGLAMSAALPTDVSGGLGNYASIPDNMGGMIGVSQEAYDAVQNPMQGSLANSGGEGFMGGLSGALGNKDLMTGISGLASAAGTGFDIYDKLWGSSAKTAKSQQNLLNQQAAANAQALKEHTDFKQGLVKSGLAANA